MNKEKEDFFLHSNEVNHINREDYDKIELLVNAAKAFARSTYQCVYIIDYFHQDFIYASDNLAYLCGLEPEQLMEAGYQMYIDHVPDADLQMLLEVNKKGCKRIREAAFFLIIMLVTFAATLLKPQNYVSSRTIQKCVEHVSTST